MHYSTGFFCLPVTINFLQSFRYYRETSFVTLGLMISQNICLDVYFICNNRALRLLEFSLVEKNPSFQREDTNLLFFYKLLKAECNPLPGRFLEIFINRNILST